MSPNWFIGFPVAARGWYAARVPAPPAGFRRQHPEDLHFTLAFLGPVREEEARAAWEALGPVGGPMEIRLGAVVPMGPSRRYSALSALVVEGREVIEATLTRLRGPCLEAAGCPPAPRAAKAHLTVARPLRRATSAQRREGLRWAEDVDLSGVRLRLTRISLFTWTEARRERLFRVVAERKI